MTPIKNDCFNFLYKVGVFGELFYFKFINFVDALVGGCLQSNGAFDVILSRTKVALKVSQSSSEGVNLLESLLVSF